MNNARRQLLRDAVLYLEKAQKSIRVALSQEEDSLSNMPENLEFSERYEKMEQAIDGMNDVLDSIESAEDMLEEVIQIRCI